MELGLTVMLFADKRKYFMTSAFFEGFKVLVHHPEDFPEVKDKGFVVGPGQEMFVSVDAHGTIDIPTRFFFLKYELLHFRRLQHLCCPGDDPRPESVPLQRSKGTRPLQELLQVQLSHGVRLERNPKDLRMRALLLPE